MPVHNDLYLRIYRTYPGIVRTVTAQYEKSLLVWEPEEPKMEKVRTATALSDVSKVAERFSYSHLEQLVAIEDDVKRSCFELECQRVQ